MAVRVRFAPSPTGPLHIGGLRTALYNYLFARRHGGVFILRIEDTDQKRLVPAAEAYINEALAWVGLTPDEGVAQGGDYGPYRQSERTTHYQAAVKQLLDQGLAYRAFDTAKEIETMRAVHGHAGHGAKYDHSTRSHMRNELTMSAEEVSSAMASGLPYVVRLKVTPDQSITFEDAIRGAVTFSSTELDDKVLMKSDGLPTYHLANVVDDLHMEISHVIRGEEWLSSTPHHVLLYQALGRYDDMPTFAHLPLILKPTGKGKLSKRDGAKLGIPVFPLLYDDGGEVYPGFRELGFLPAAVVNFLALLGWNPGDDEEVMSIQGLAQKFDLAQVQKGGARFDMDKATWFNQQYIQSLDVDQLAQLVWSEDLAAVRAYDKAAISAITTLLRPRLHRLQDFEEQAVYFFSTPESYDEKIIRKKWKDKGIAMYHDITTAYGDLSEWSAEALKATLEAVMADHDSGYGQILPLLRIAITGSTKGPDLFEVMAILGAKTTIDRLNIAHRAFHEIVAQ